jgi:hypothetical protein
MSIYRKIRLYTFVLTAFALPGCALLKKPTPLTQLQISLNEAELNWPAQLELASVKARGVLQSDRVIVINGALVMQHADLRWVAAPSAQLAEQLAIARLAALTADAQKASGKAATVDFWLNDFNIVVSASGDTSVAVSASAAVRCANAKSASQLAPASIVLPLNSADPQRIAERFDTAAGKVLTNLLARVSGYCPHARN